MKRTIVSLAVMIIAAISVNAQQPEQSMKQEHHQPFRHKGHGRGGGDMLAKKLNFSDQQKEQLKNSNSDYRKKIMDLKKHDEITVKEFKSQMSALHKEHRSQVQAIFTPEQREQIAKMKQEKMEMAKVNAGARVEKMKIKLGLTDEQASKLKNIRTDMVTKMKSVHTDNSLSQEQKREQIKSIVLQQHDQLKTILTADQLQQLQQMKEGAHRGGSQQHRRDFSK